MKRSEFKSMLKPLVKECVREAIFEEGVLSGIISEVMLGLGKPTITEAPQSSPPNASRKVQSTTVKQNNHLQEHRHKLMEAVGSSAYNGVNLFEGTTPGPAQSSPQQQAGALSGQSAADPGVDIASLVGNVGTHWNAHMSDVKE